MRFGPLRITDMFVCILTTQLILHRVLPSLYVRGDELETDNKKEASMSSTNTNTTDADQELPALATSSQGTVQAVQAGPFVDLLGPTLLSLQMIDDTHAQINSHATTDALKGKKVAALYFSADWCGPCRSFTPELVAFSKKINRRRGSSDTFAIVWVSRCRDIQAWGQYFTHMNGFFALPPEEAAGPRGNALFQKYKGTSIPYLVLLEGDTADLITTDARNRIPQDKAGIGFPWRSPIVILYNLICPKSLRFMLRDQTARFWMKIQAIFKGVLGLHPTK